MSPDVLEAIVAARAAKTPAVLVTRLASGRATLLLAPALKAEGPVEQAALRALAEDKPQLMETDEGEIFLNPFNPPLRMAILGAVHIAQPLSAMASLMGYTVTVIDPRTAFATAARFPGVALDRSWPDEAMTALRPDRRTAVIALTHDPKLDDPALDVALKSGSFYIAALGSKKTHAARLERLRRRGHSEETLARIRGPAGLAIGAKTPAEIAVSILAEATAALRSGAP